MVFFFCCQLSCCCLFVVVKTRREGNEWENRLVLEKATSEGLAGNGEWLTKTLLGIREEEGDVLRAVF